MTEDQSPDLSDVPDPATVAQRGTPLSRTGEPAVEPDTVPLHPRGAGTERYLLVQEIARGGMGVVYRAHDRVLDREVGLKTLIEVPTDPRIVMRFREEARINGQLQHPNIPPVHDLGTLFDGRPFLAMKLIKGKTLAALLHARPDPAEDRGRFLAIFEHIAQGVAYAHAHKVIHRDLKPANVMVGAFGEVQVMDWGLAKVLSDAVTNGTATVDRPTSEVTEIRALRDDTDGTRDETQDGTVMGTPQYMPPEQAIGAVDQIDTRSDVFSLGGVLCVILTGKPPYTGATAAAVRQLAARANLSDAFARLDECGAEPNLTALCKRCLSSEPEERFRDAGEVAKAVADLRAETERRARQAELDLVRVEGELVKAQLRAAEQRNRDALAVVLERCEEALRADDTDAAALALAEAEKRSREGGTSELAPRVERCRSDLALLLELNEIEDYRFTLSEAKDPKFWRLVSHRWKRALAWYGIAPASTPPLEVGERINRSLVRDQLLETLDEWLLFVPSEPLAAALIAADPDDYRAAVRTAMSAGDVSRVRSLADEPAALEQPARFAVVQGSDKCLPNQRREEILQRVILTSPTHFRLLATLGTICLAGQRNLEALRWYQAAVAVRPNRGSSWSNVGAALMLKGDLTRAEPVLNHAIRLQPRSAIAHLNLGMVHFQRGEFQTARIAFERVLSISPNIPMAHCNLGAALINLGEFGHGAVACRRAIQLDPALAMAHTNLGVCLGKLGDHGGALVAHRQALAADPTSLLAHRNLGAALMEEKDYKEALEVFRAALALDPRYASAHYHVGIILARTQNFSEAVASLRRAAELAPRDADIRHDLGWCLQALGLLDEALVAYQEANRLDPANTKYQQDTRKCLLAIQSRGSAS